MMHMWKGRKFAKLCEGVESHGWTWSVSGPYPTTGRYTAFITMWTDDRELVWQSKVGTFSDTKEAALQEAYDQAIVRVDIQ